MVAAALALAAFLVAKVTGFFRPAEAASAPLAPAKGEAREEARGALAEVGRIGAGRGIAGAFVLMDDGHFVVAFGKEARIVAPGGTPGGTPTVVFEASGPISALAAAGKGVFAASGGDVLFWDGKDLRPFAQLGSGAKVVSLALDAGTGDLYCADAASKLIYRYSGAGRLLRIIGAADEKAGVPGFIVPSPYFAIAFSAAGELVAANPGRHGVETYSPDGELLSAFYAPGQDGFSGCCNPACIFLTAEGTILSYEKGLSRVKEMGRDGKTLRVLVAGGELGFLPSPLLQLGAAAAGAFGLPPGSIALLDREAGELRFFAEAGS